MHKLGVPDYRFMRLTILSLTTPHPSASLARGARAKLGLDNNYKKCEMVTPFGTPGSRLGCATPHYTPVGALYER